MTESPDAAPSIFRLREGWIATLFLLGATVVLLLVTRTDVVQFAPQEPLYLVTAGLFALSIPGPIVRLWDLPAQLFLWNAMGWGTGLVLFGLASVGSLPILPLILAALGVSFWPHEPGSTVPWQAIAIALLGGLLVCWVAWGDIVFDIPFDYGIW
jgi:hypothetical protein